MKNGEYVIYDKTNFTTPDFCGYIQVKDRKFIVTLVFVQNCDENGFLQMSECPNGKLWDAESSKCLDLVESCAPEEKWLEQHDVDLEDCIGLVDGRCQLGFVEFDRAKKYCENDEVCLGVKLTECNKITENNIF